MHGSVHRSVHGMVHVLGVDGGLEGDSKAVVGVVLLSQWLLYTELIRCS